MKKAVLTISSWGYLLWETIIRLRYVWWDRKRLIQQMDHVGVSSIPVVLLIGFFAGAIIAWQGAYQVRGLVSYTILGGQVSRVIMMEMGPVLTAMVISGRIGASMAAEIGSMKISEQIDALKTMSIDPVRYLVLPRFLGLSLMMPVLCVFALCAAMLGAWLVSNYFLDITVQVFFGSVRSYFHLGDLSGGLIKSVIFGMIISMTGCNRGFQAQKGARGVGKATIDAFVISSVLILLADFLLWVILFNN
ncbi:MAG: ABC transporter permease [Bacteroidota bacterium]